MSPAAALWRWGTRCAAPLLPLYLRARLRRGKEWPDRLAERRGEGAARPAGRLVWLHAASVGETLSILPLLQALADRAADLSLLVTTGTVTSATLLQQRLPPALQARVQHRFVPLDVPAWAARFLDDWRPDLAGFIESELWPNLIAAARARGIPLALVNARMSLRSATRWRMADALAAELLGSFRLVLAQSADDAARLRALGAPLVQAPGNLKYAAAPLPADAARLAELRDAIGARPVLLAASTHAGEETQVAAALAALRPRHPDLLGIIVPRHPERGVALAEELGAPRRSAGAMPGPRDTLYIADTLGELGLFYRLASVAVVGGSLVPHGGQNPLEPARLGCPILLGPHTHNFTEPVAALLAAGGAIQLQGPDLAAALAAAAGDVLSKPDRGRALAGAAATVVADGAELPGRIADALLALLPGPGAAATAVPAPGHERGSVEA